VTFFLVLYSEFLKLKRTKITWVVGLLYSFGPLGMGFFMAILMNPELAGRMGLLTTKAELTVGTADWPTYLSLIGIILAAGSIVIGIIQAFVFGREYTEGTAKNMLSLPIGRSNFAAAKLLVSAVWYTCIAAVVYGEAILVGLLVGLPGFDPALIGPSMRVCLLVLLETLLLSSLPAWVAVAGRGYLASIGYSIFTSIVLGQIFLHTGWAPWVPWSIVYLTAGAGEPGAPAAGAGSLLVLAGVFVAGFIALYLTLDRADNTQ
jgi:ABC-type transport system involved in multi-copper enzyme maturation permease subunit